jgi:hypothetical protein
MGMMKAIFGDAVEQEAAINHQTLLAAVQTAMFCQLTGAILDVRTAVLITVKRGEGVSTAVIETGAAYDEAGKAHVATVRERFPNATIEIIDGREFTSRGEYRAAKYRERAEALLAGGTVE